MIKTIVSELIFLAFSKFKSKQKIQGQQIFKNYDHNQGKSI